MDDDIAVFAEHQLYTAAPDGFVMPFVENYDRLQPMLAREIRSDLIVKIIELFSQNT